MPKVPKTSELRQHRRTKLEENARWKQNVPSTMYLQVLGNGTHGSPRSVHLFTTHQRYLFNCGEGTQRLAHEHKVKLARLEHAFITYKSWENIGGLPGLALTIQDIGVPSIMLHGPPGVEHLFRITSNFLLTRDIEITKREFTELPYEDGALKVVYVPLFGKAIVTSEEEVPSNEEQINYYDWPGKSNRGTNEEQSRSKTPDEESQPPANKKVRLSPLNDEPQRDISIAFICKPHSKQGPLLLERCVEFGVPVGPLLGELKNGRDVTLPNGTVVSAKDVVAPDEPGPVFIVIECPSVDFLDSLLEAKQFERHQMSARSEEDCAEVVVHFTPSSVMQHAKYQDWMQRFSPSTHHLLVNDACSGCSTLAVHRIQHKLHLLHSDVFPLLKDEQECRAKPDSFQHSVPLIVHSQPLLNYYLRPRKKIDNSCLLTVNPEEYHNEVTANPSCVEALDELKKTLIKSTISNSGAKYPEIVFFGTGSSIPSKVRNVSSILVHLSVDKSMLLDCGEGTYSQLHRFYGREGARSVLKKLTAIFVSHLHADHHMGLMQLLLERQKVISATSVATPLYLVAPHQINYWLKSFHAQFQPITEDLRLVPNAQLLYNRRTLVDDEYRELIAQLELSELTTETVIHCKHAFGIIISHIDGWKLVYSGDTMPCDALVEAGKGCNILIHEATMEDDLVAEARIKTHSTTSEAIEVGRKMGSDFTILTHFSQRYAKVPFFTDNFTQCVGVAFDNMKVSLRTLPIIPHFIPALKAIFSDDYEEMQDQRDKKMRKKEREATKVQATLKNTPVQV